MLRGSFRYLQPSHARGTGPITHTNPATVCVRGPARFWAAPGIAPGTSRTRSENHATRPSSRWMAARRPAIGWGEGHTGKSMMCGSSMVLQARHTRASVPATHTNVAMLCVCALRACGLLRELNPGPLAPEARIMPLDQATLALPDRDRQTPGVAVSIRSAC